MATFDEIARQGCKLSGPELLVFLNSFAEEPMEVDFAAWDDTRRTSWPGGPERIDDVVVVLRRKADGSPAHLIVEAETEPQQGVLARLGIYELMLSLEVRAGREVGPPIYGALIHLTGRIKVGPLILTRSARKPGVLVEPIEIWLADLDGSAWLDLVDAGTMPLWTLIWVVLMKGGGDPLLIERWKTLADREPDDDKRAAYRFFVLAFAELMPELVNWQRALEGWNVRESMYVKSIENRGIERGEVRRARADVIRLVETQANAPVPEPIRLAIEGTNDLTVLDRWFTAAIGVASWAEFERRMKQP